MVVDCCGLLFVVCVYDTCNMLNVGMLVVIGVMCCCVVVDVVLVVVGVLFVVYVNVGV